MPAKRTVTKVNQTVNGSSAVQAPTQDGPTALPKFNMSLWESGSAGVLRTRKIIPNEGDFFKQDAYWEAIGAFEQHVGKQVTEYASAITAMQEFDTWLDTSGWQYQAPVLFVPTGFHINITMRAPSGDVTVGMDYSSLGEDKPASLRAAFDFIQSAVKEAFPGKKAEPQQAKEPSDKMANLDVEDAHAEVLRVKSYQGKTAWVLIPDEGKWTQYGVPLYKDVARKFGFDLPTEPGEYAVDIDFRYELKEAGTPRRVISLTDNESG